MSRTRLVAALAIVVITACQPAETETEATKSSGDESAAIGQVRDAWAAAWKQADAAALAAMYTADAADMNNHMATNTGSQAIQASLAASFEQMTPTDITLTAEKTETSGDFAYDRGTYQLTLTPKAGGAPVTDSGRYLVVLKRQADGSWKLAEAMGNSAVPLPAPAR